MLIGNIMLCVKVQQILSDDTLDTLLINSNLFNKAVKMCLEMHVIHANHDELIAELNCITSKKHYL